MHTGMKAFVLAIATAALTGAAVAHPHHYEMLIGRNSSGQLLMYTHSQMPFKLNRSIFPGFDGWADAGVEFSSLDFEYPALDIYDITPTAHIQAFLVSEDPGIHVHNGLPVLPVGQYLDLGVPYIHFGPVWNIYDGVPGQVFHMQFYFHDATGQFADSEVFTVLLTPECGDADFNEDGDVGTDADIEAFFACLSGSCCATCYDGGADFNGDGDVGTDADIESFFRVLGGGPC
jgi:hypothetical protein